MQLLVLLLRCQSCLDQSFVNVHESHEIFSVFSSLNRISLHFLTGGLLNNVFGGLYGGILWVLVEQHLKTNEVSINGNKSPPPQ